MTREIKFTKEHEWVFLETGAAEDAMVITVGITDYAQHALGDLVYIELPKLGVEYKKGDHFAVVESVKTAAEVYTPVSGRVVAVNQKLENDYDLLSSQEQGWIAKFAVSSSEELDGLMTRKEYEDYLAGL